MNGLGPPPLREFNKKEKDGGAGTRATSRGDRDVPFRRPTFGTQSTPETETSRGKDAPETETSLGEDTPETETIQGVTLSQILCSQQIKTLTIESWSVGDLVIFSYSRPFSSHSFVRKRGENRRQ